MRALRFSPIPPADRVGMTIAQTPDFAWAFRFLQEFPQASLSLIGSSVRDAVLGRVLPFGELLITNASPSRVAYWLHTSPPPSFLRISTSVQSLGSFLSSQLFSLDALAYDIGRGTFHDPFSGVSHMQKGLLTSVSSPHAGLRAQPHQALRGLRLSAELGVSPEPRLWRALLAHIPHNNHLTTDEFGFATYRTPRRTVISEALLALTHGGIYGWDLFSRARALELAFPHFTNDSLHEKAHLHFLSAHDHALRTRYGSTPLSDTFLLAALYAPHEDRAQHYQHHAALMEHAHVAHPRLSFNSSTAARILAKTHALLTENPSLWSLSRSEKILSGDDGISALNLAHITTLHDTSLHEYIPRIARAALTRDSLVRDVRPAPLLRGRDLLPLGLSSGPHIRMYLNLVRDEQLKGGLRTKEDALSFVRDLVRNPS